MAGGRLLVVVVLSSLALGGCGSGGDDSGAATDETTEAVAATSNKAVEQFAAWYRAAVREGGDAVPARLRESDPSSDEAMKGLIRILCAANAPDTPSRHAAAQTIKNDPEFFGDASFAASAIVQARIACGLDD
jgi:hypothetical protein